jgi:hypothetical protein
LLSVLRALRAVGVTDNKDRTLRIIQDMINDFVDTQDAEGLGDEFGVYEEDDDD